MVNTIAMITFEFIFKRIATYLTKLENHRTQEEFDEGLSLKIILFQLVNCYISSLLIAFWYKDFGQLTTDLVTKLVFKQLGINILEYATHRCITGRKISKIKARFAKTSEED